LSSRFREIHDHAVALSYQGIILSVKAIINTTKKLVALAIDIGDHINGMGVVATITNFFSLQFMIDKRIAAGKKQKAANNNKCIFHNGKCFM
jgi:hypothetical protein